jgi:flavin reductase (DIM6/NTAB) family NADH-FMN oxidoreductase RutF
MPMFVESDTRRAEWEIPSGVFVVTLLDGDRVNGYAAGWVVRVSEVPVMIQVAVWDQNYSFELSQSCSHFAVHILEQGQQPVARHFGRRCGRDCDKLEGYATQRGVSGIPILEDCLAHLECEVIARQVYGDHMVLVGRAIDKGIHREGTALIYNYEDYQ